MFKNIPGKMSVLEAPGAIRKAVTMGRVGPLNILLSANGMIIRSMTKSLYARKNLKSHEAQPSQGSKGGFVKYSSYVTNDEYSSPFMEHWTLDANWSTNHKSYCGGRWTWPTPLQC